MSAPDPRSGPAPADLPDVTRARVRLLMAASATSSFDRFVTGPLLVTLAAAFSADLHAAAVVASAYSLLYGAAQPLWGLCSDRFGRVRTMRIALAVVTVVGSAAVLAPTLATLTVARAVGGAAMAAIVPTCLVYIGDVVPFERRAATLTDLSSAAAVGIATATAAGGVLAATVSWRVAFAVPVVLAAVLVHQLGRLPEPDLPRADRGGLLRVVRHRAARTVLLLALVEGAVLLGLLTYLPPALESTGSSPSVAGLVVSLYGVALLLSSQVVKRLAPRTTPATLVGCGAGTLVLAYLVLAADQGVVAVAVAACMVGAGWAALHPTMQTWATEVVPGARASMVSMFAGALFLGGGLATGASAPLAGDARWGLLFGGSAVLAAAFGLVATLSRRRFRPGDTVRTACLP